jgi:hypothetical protein
LADGRQAALVDVDDDDAGGRWSDAGRAEEQVVGRVVQSAQEGRAVDRERRRKDDGQHPGEDNETASRRVTRPRHVGAT